MDSEFGQVHGRVLTRELVIDRLGGRTADQALADGVATTDVWLELCIANDVPVERRHGRGLPAPR